MDGLLAEMMIEQVLKNIFSPLLVWRSPQIVKGTKRRELTDVVALFNNTGYLFESKFVSANTSDNQVPKNFEKRIAKAIKKASRQLQGAHRQLMQAPAFGNIAKWRAIIVLVTPVDVFKSVCRFQEIQSSNTIHYISIHDFQRILEFFDTPADFEGYLAFREKFYSLATSRDFRLKPTENDLISFYVLGTAYSEEPDKHFERFFSTLHSKEIGAVVYVLSGEQLFVNRKKDLQVLRDERQQFRHVDILIENILNSPTAKIGTGTPIASLAARSNIEVNVPMNRASVLTLWSYLAQLDRRMRISIGKLLEQTMDVSRISTNSSAAFIVKAGDLVFHFFTCSELSEHTESFFQVNTLVAKYGMKASSVFGVGYFGRTIDESEFRVVYWQEDWKYDEFMQDAWDNNPYFDTDKIVHQKLTGLTLPVKFKIRPFRGCPCGSGRAYLLCHRFKRPALSVTLL